MAYEDDDLAKAINEVRHLDGQCSTLLRENERLRDCLKWLLENDELTNYGQKTAREALELKE